MAAERSFFLSLDSQSWGKHFHDSGGIHLNLPSSFTYYYIKTRHKCQVFFDVFLVAGVGVEPTETGL